MDTFLMLDNYFGFIYLIIYVDNGFSCTLQKSTL